MKNSFDGTARGVMPLLMFGEDSTSEGLIKVLRMKPEIHKVFIITDEGVKNAGHLKPIEETLAGAGYESEVWDSVEQDPSEVTYDSIAAFGLKKKVDAVIGLGGGAVLDVAKCVALMQKNKGKIWDYEMGKGVDPENVGVPWIGIPTTSGTGSEVSA